VDSFQNLNALESRVYKLRDPAMEFICPLCRTERAFTVSHKLSKLHFLQMIFLTSLVVWIFYPYAGIKTLPVFFGFWAIFEIVVRVRFKNEIPCPHCGFDATWYQKDVKVARQKVREFWESKKPAPENNAELSEIEVEESNSQE